MNALRSSSSSVLNASTTSCMVKPTAASTSGRLEIAQKLLLTPFGLTEAHLSKALAEIT
jgi:TldD protein